MKWAELKPKFKVAMSEMMQWSQVEKNSELNVLCHYSLREDLL